MKNIQAILGPTGTGKTQLALSLASSKKSLIISADSRQVYIGMDIVTGKDHPADFTLHGIDLVYPDESFSVSVWHDAVMPLINSASDDTQIIVVGGTGFYLRALLDNIQTLSVPINLELRTTLESKSTSDLQSQLISLAPEKFSKMNRSDSLNPRRLIRAIEVASSNTTIDQKQNNPDLQFNMIGLYYSDLVLQKSVIKKRVLSRLELGAIDETKALLKKYSSTLPSFTAIGYRSIIKYLNQSLTYDEMVEQWVAEEFSYVKRQLTFFRKFDVTWYDRGIIDYKEIKL